MIFNGQMNATDENMVLTGQFWDFFFFASITCLFFHYSGKEMYKIPEFILVQIMQISAFNEVMPNLDI